MGRAITVHKSDPVLALMELIARWQGEDINKNLLHTVISALNKRHQTGARLDAVMGKDKRVRKPAMYRMVERPCPGSRSCGGETPRPRD